jgi:hypothetical protein
MARHLSIIAQQTRGISGDGKIWGFRQMSAVERLDNQDALVASPRDIPNPAIAAVLKSRSSAQKDTSAAPKDDKSARGKRLRPLLAVAPYLARYRTKTLA